MTTHTIAVQSGNPVPLPPISEGLKRIIEEPWRRQGQGRRLTRSGTPTVVKSPSELGETDEVDA